MTNVRETVWTLVKKKKSWNAGSDSPFHTLIGDLILLLMF